MMSPDPPRPADASPAPDRRRARVRFLAALALFVAWAATLGTLVVASGRGPARAVAKAGR
jgi:hypothetical protein